MIKIANRQIFIFFFDFLNKNMGPSNMGLYCISVAIFYFVYSKVNAQEITPIRALHCTALKKKRS